MRRFICIFSAFTLLLAGCVKNEPLTSGGQETKAEIAFESPIVAPKTKSLQQVLNYPSNLNFKVCGFYSQGYGPIIDGASILNKYIDGAEFGRSGNVWAGLDKPYYWFPSAYLHFVAYAPSRLSGSLLSSTVTAEGLQLNGYTVPDEANEDLMVSQIAYKRSKPAIAGEGSPLVFDHALTSILFQVKSGVYGDRTSADPDRIDTDLRIVKIEVVDARASGDFSQQMTSWNNEQMNSPAAAQNPEKGWTVADNAAVKTFVAYEGEQMLTDSYQLIHDLPSAASGYSLTNLILLPQEIKDNVKLKVTYDMTHSNLSSINGQENLWLEDEVVEIPMNQCGITEWLRGYRYVYNLTLSLGKIQCSIEALPWDEYETLEYVDGMIHDLNEREFTLK